MPTKINPLIPQDDYVPSDEAAHVLCLDAATLAQWRYLRKFHSQLPYFKVGRKVLYRLSDLHAFLESCRVGGDDLNGGEK
jgi:hypothetical protein